MKKRIRIQAGLIALLVLPAAWAQETRQSLLPGHIYTLDRTHSALTFTARHIGYSKVRGIFKNYDVALFYVEEDITQSSVTVVAQMDSIETNSSGRDTQLRSSNILDVEKYPLMTFQSDRVERSGNGYVLVGPLTIRNVTRTVRIPFEVITDKSRDQWGHTRISFEGALAIDRNDFDIVYRDSEFWDSIISDTIQIEIDAGLRIYNYLDSVFPKWRTENSIGKLALEWAEKNGLDAAILQVEEMWKSHREDYDFRLSQIYRAGRMLMQKGQYGDALAVFRLASRLYADSAEPADLAEIYAVIGEMQARLGYEAYSVSALDRALELSPTNVRAKELRRVVRRLQTSMVRR